MARRVIGLTGGIATGKSQVTHFLADKAFVIDADKLVHKLQLPGGILYQVLVAHFGESILDDSGRLDRKQLAKSLFSDESKRDELSKCQDPIIRESLKDALRAAQEQESLIVMDIPLLYEKGYDEWCDEVWVVSVDQETQIIRLMERDGLNRDEALLRLSAQMPLAEKEKRADLVLDNTGHQQELYRQVEDALDQLGRT